MPEQYEYIEYPKSLVKGDETVIVESAEDEALYRSEGFAVLGEVVKEKVKTKAKPTE